MVQSLAKGSGQFTKEPRIRHFVLGENRWRQADSFPNNADHILYLRSAGRANSRKGDGVLASDKPATDEPADIFVYGTEVPVPAPGGSVALGGQFDQSALELGNNLLVYTSASLEAPLRIFGVPRISLDCASSAAHTDFTAKLVRVRPTGAAEFICVGIARSGWLFANSGYAADTLHRWEFDLEPTSCLFAAGERIRLEIASSAFPLYDRNPGTGIASAAPRHGTGGAPRRPFITPPAGPLRFICLSARKPNDSGIQCPGNRVCGGNEKLRFGTLGVAGNRFENT